MYGYQMISATDSSCGGNFLRRFPSFPLTPQKPAIGGFSTSIRPRADNHTCLFIVHWRAGPCNGRSGAAKCRPADGTYMKALRAAHRFCEGTPVWGGLVGPFCRNGLSDAARSAICSARAPTF
jgi:hypothetical protein